MQARSMPHPDVARAAPFSNALRSGSRRRALAPRPSQPNGCDNCTSVAAPLGKTTGNADGGSFLLLSARSATAPSPQCATCARYAPIATTSDTPTNHVAYAADTRRREKNATQGYGPCRLEGFWALKPVQVQ